MTGVTAESLWHLGSRLLAMAHTARQADARTTLRATIARFSITPEEDDTPIRILLGLLETAVVLGNREAVALLAPRLVEVPGMSVPLTCASLHVARGYALLGDRDAAAHHERALGWTTRMRHRPELALTRLGLAELRLDELRVESSELRVGTADTEPATRNSKLETQREALAQLDFAIEEFRAMKMQPPLERALRHKGLLGA